MSGARAEKGRGQEVRSRGQEVSRREEEQDGYLERGGTDTG